MGIPLSRFRSRARPRRDEGFRPRGRGLGRWAPLLAFAALALAPPLEAEAQGPVPSPQAPATTKSPAGASPAALAELEVLGESALKLAVEKLRGAQDAIVNAMGERAIAKSLKEADEVRLYIGFVPLLALIVVPIWLWRRRAFARRDGATRARVLTRGFFATLAVTVMLWGFVQIFFFIEDFKRNFADTSPAQGLASNALLYVLEKGPEVAKGGSQLGELLSATLVSISQGQKAPEALLGHLFDNARRLKDTWAFKLGYRIYSVVFPWLDYFGPALLVVLLIVFLRFAIPGIREIVQQASGELEGSFVRTLLRHLRIELLAMGLFVIPFIGVTLISVSVTWLVTGVAARGIVDNTFNAVTLFYAGNVNPELVIANFGGVIAFIFEIVGLLFVVTAILLSNWVQMLHEKFQTRGSFWSYRRFIPHALRTTLRLYLTLLAPSIVLAFALDQLGQHHADLGPTMTMLVPVFLLVTLNVLLFFLRFGRGLRRALDASLWRPPAPAPLGVASPKR